MPLSPGTQLGSYEIVSLLGAGGMGRGLSGTRSSRDGQQLAIARSTVTSDIVLFDLN